MNYIDNGEYYLVAKYPNDKSEVVNIKKDWYLYNKDENFQQRVDISAIDLITTKFNNEEQMKSRMYENKYIKSIDADLYIVHYHKNKGKEFINEYEVVYNENDRINIISPLAKKRLYNQEIKQLDIDNLENKLISKSFSKYSFFQFMTCPWSNVDEWIKSQLIEQRNKQKINYGIKYKIKTNYVIMHNIISMWNLYDKLVKEYEISNPIYGEEELAKGIIELYKKKLNKTDLRKENNGELKKMIDRKNVPGQIDINDYLNSKNETSDDTVLMKSGNNIYDVSYKQQMNDMYQAEKMIKDAPFDDLSIGKLVEEKGVEYVASQANRDFLEGLTLEDKFRLGLIDNYVKYKNMKRQQDRQKSDDGKGYC